MSVSVASHHDYLHQSIFHFVVNGITRYPSDHPQLQVPRICFQPSRYVLYHATGRHRRLGPLIYSAERLSRKPNPRYLGRHPEVYKTQAPTRHKMKLINLDQHITQLYTLSNKHTRKLPQEQPSTSLRQTQHNVFPRCPNCNLHPRRHGCL
jgi:hypothetical protein